MSNKQTLVLLNRLCNTTSFNFFAMGYNMYPLRKSHDTNIVFQTILLQFAFIRNRTINIVSFIFPCRQTFSAESAPAPKTVEKWDFWCKATMRRRQYLIKQ